MRLEVNTTTKDKIQNTSGGGGGGGAINLEFRLDSF